MSSETLDRGAAREIAPDVLHGIPSARRRFRLNPRLGIAALGLLAAAAVAGYGWNWWEVGRFVETTDDAYVGGNVTTLSPHVAGFVTKILVNDNQLVKAGQLLIQLDDRDYKANLAHAEAVVQHQTAALANLHAKYDLQKSMIAAGRSQTRGGRGRSRLCAGRRRPLPCARGDHLWFVAERSEGVCRGSQSASRGALRRSRSRCRQAAALGHRHRNRRDRGEPGAGTGRSAHRRA